MGRGATAQPAAKNAGKQQSKGSQYDDTNRGVLFDNDKDGVETRPDMTGHVFINPADYEKDAATGLVKIRLAAWSKHSDRTGADYLSLSASPSQD